MSNQKKYSYRSLKPEEGRRYLINAFKSGATLTIWEPGNLQKKVVIAFSVADTKSQSLTLSVDEMALPSEWKYASLLYHIMDSNFSFLGKVLSEKRNGQQTLVFDPHVYVLEKRKFFRLSVIGKYPFHLRIKFVNPPLLIAQRNDNVVSIYDQKDPSRLWMSFIEFVKKFAPASESSNEVYVNFPIIDLSASGIAIPLTTEESKFFASLGTIENAATIYFSNEMVEIPKLTYVHTTPWEFPDANNRLKAGFNFSDDLWVRKQLETKLKSFIVNVEEGFDKFLK